MKKKLKNTKHRLAKNKNETKLSMGISLRGMHNY